MLFFKSKKEKAEERMEKEWNDHAATAMGQLKSSMFNVGQVQKFCSFIEGRKYSNHGRDILQSLVEAKLFDGTPLLSKFFIYSSADYYKECSIGMHNLALVAFIDQTGFDVVDMINSNWYDKSLATEQVKYIRKQYMTDDGDVKTLVEFCNKYYKALEDLRAKIAITDKTLLMPQFTKVRWGGTSFCLDVVVRPERVNRIIEHLKPLNLKYLDEYRAYMIDALANASITHAVKGSKVMNIQYDQPTAYCNTYMRFEENHVAKLNREAKNHENKTVIDEIRAAAQKKIDNEQNS